MEPISVFDWVHEYKHDLDHIYFYAWAVDPSARGAGALKRLPLPFSYADDHGFNCYLECYSDRLQQMYEHIAFELIDELHSLDFEVYEWRIVRHPKL